MKAFVIALVVSVLVPAAGVALAIANADEERALETPRLASPISAPIRQVESVNEEAITLTFKYTTGRQVLSQRTGGTVQQVIAKPGDELDTGAWIAVVDGSLTLGYVAERPFYRKLSDGTVGPDVAAAEDLLVALGYLDEDRDTERFDWKIRSATKELNKDLGAGGNDFDPVVLVWVGETPMRPSSIDIVAGDQYPAPGDPVVSGPRAIESATVKNADGEQLKAADLAGRKIRLDGLDIELGEKGLDIEDREAISNHLPSSPEEVEGVLELSSAVTLNSVPASAIVLDVNGDACIYTADQRPVPVEIVDGEPGRAYIESADLANELPSEVLANPNDVIERARCE